jgi:DNA-binding Xre family transcriptional regulator
MDTQKKTVRGLADATGLSTQTILRATKDDGIETLTLATLAKIAGALHVSVKELFDE